MEKFIAVVNPRMEDDEISHLIGKGIAGALFNISHQNYPLAAKMIEQVRTLSEIHDRPVSIIQDISEMEDPLDLRFGIASGVDWVATDKEEHVKMAKGLSKLANVIYKGRNLPKGVRVDSIMADGFLDPDARVLGKKTGLIKHLILDNKDQDILDTLLDIATHAGSSAIAVSDLDLVKALSFRRPSKKIIFAPEDHNQAAQGSIYRDVFPMYSKKNLVSSLKQANIIKKGERVVDATDAKHVRIQIIG